MYRVSLVVLIAVIPFSRALISITTVSVFVAALAEFILNRPRVNFRNLSFICLASIVLFCVLDGFRAWNTEEWIRTMETKLPVLIFPFSFLIFQEKLEPHFFRQASVVLCLTVTASALASMYNYFVHYEEINQLVLQSKNVPIIGGMHHITYSVYCAFASILSAMLAFRYRWKMMWVLSAVNFVALHILTARTGLVGFYFSFLVLGLVYILNHRPPKRVLLAGIALILILPVLAFYGIGSFHNRALNTWEDLKVVWHQKDANYQSMGMRVEAAKTAFGIIRKHPLTGVGNSNIKKAMGVQYEANNTNLFLENRILPHNQFIMEATVHGLIGLGVLMLFFLAPLFGYFARQPLLFITLWSLIFFACMFECLFDRQHGILLVSLFWFIYRAFDPGNEKSIERLHPV